MLRKKRTILIILILVIVGGGWYAYHLYNMPVGTLEKINSDMTIDAASLLAEYQENEEAANSKFLDKIITVSGEIAKIEKDAGISIYLNTEDPMSQVVCQLDHTYTDVSDEIGDKIKVKGLCTGFLMDVLLVNSTITK